MSATAPQSPDRLPAAVARAGFGGRLLVAGALLALLALAWPALRSRLPAGMPATGSADVGDRAGAVVPARPGQDRAAGTRTVPASAPATPAASLQRRFETEQDLFAYWRDLQRAARDGDAEATWMMSQVADYCAAYGRDPGGYALDTRRIVELGVRGVAGMVKARERIGHRCRGFTVADGLAPRVLELREDAARRGNLAAEASLLAMGRPLDEDAGYAARLIDRVRGSRDADAYNALSPAMGNASFAADAGLGNASQFGELAWRLAACRLGMDCGPDSNLMTAYCANGGICSRRPGQGFETFVYDAAVPNQGAEVLDDMVQTLMDDGKGEDEKKGEGI